MTKAAVIIGGGPAGCQCALWLKMLGYESVIIEKSDRLGGLQAISPYENNWLVGTMNLQGIDIANNIQNHIEKMNISVIYDCNIKHVKSIPNGFEIDTGTDVLEAHNIVIATGVKPATGSFKSTENVIIGPGKKIFHVDFSGKRVAILGGGDSAAENYSFISKKNPILCHVFARSTKARQKLWSELKSSDVFLGSYHADQASMTVTYKNTKQEYDYFIVLYGWKSNIPDSLIAFHDQLVNEYGFITVDTSRKTNISNIFAAGEVTNYLHPCVATAMADGVIVAKSIQKQLETDRHNTS